MRLHLIEVPYDSGRFAERMGAGPRVLAAELPPLLAKLGLDVEVEPVRLPEEFFHELRAVVALQARVRAAVSTARAAGELPVVLSGNCGNAALGTVSALPPRTGVLWLDAHGDFNTPETSPSGFFDGTALAMLTGRAWTGVARALDRFSPVAEDRVVLLGARDLDAEEQRALEGSAVTWVSAAALAERPEALGEALADLAGRADGLYLHLDLDVLDPADLRANVFATPDGLRVEQVVAAIDAAAAALPILAVGVTAYDPAADEARRGPEIAARLLGHVAAAARG